MYWLIGTFDGTKGQKIVWRCRITGDVETARRALRYMREDKGVRGVKYYLSTRKDGTRRIR